MSLFQSLNVGVAGLQAQSNVLNVISDNLANINTVGYKKTSALFDRLVANDQSASSYSPGGVGSASRSLNSSQGPVQLTQSATDIAISGNGFFAVRGNPTVNSNGLFFTRSGSFTPNRDGNFVNGAGYFLQGWALTDQTLAPALSGANVDAGTAIAALTNVNVQGVTQTPVATSLVSLRTNLQSSQAALSNSSVSVTANLNAAQINPPSSRINVVANLNSAQVAFVGTYNPTISGQNMASGLVTADFTRTINVADNTGASRSVNVSFLKTASNTWAVEVFVQPSTDVTQADGLLASGNVTFNANGTLATASASLTGPITAGWNNPGGATTLTLNLGAAGSSIGLSQTDSQFSGSLTATPDYDANSATRSIASGGITPNFTRTATVLDNTGASRTLTTGFYKLSDNTWAVEIYATPASSITTAPGKPAGQVAAGTLTFNTNGTLATVSPSLTNNITVGWNNNPNANSVSYNWFSSGSFAGITQNSAVFSGSTATVRNYDPASVTQNMASGSVAPQYSTPVTIIDSLGTLHTLTAGFIKTSNNTWAVEIYASTAAEIGTTNPQIVSGTVTFNGDGTLASVSPSLTAALTVNWQTPAATTNTFTFNWGTAGAAFGTPGATVIGLADGLSQLDRNYNTVVTQNGFQAGNLRGVEITDDGFVVGQYDNGTSQKLFKIPLAKFNEANELRAISGNVFLQTNDSGVPVFSSPNQNGTGSLTGSALENSTVETEDELVNMIIAQRSYQANSKTISTTDDMLQSLTQAI